MLVNYNNCYAQSEIVEHNFDKDRNYSNVNVISSTDLFDELKIADIKSVTELMFSKLIKEVTPQKAGDGGGQSGGIKLGGVPANVSPDPNVRPEHLIGLVP